MNLTRISGLLGLTVAVAVGCGSQGGPGDSAGGAGADSALDSGADSSAGGSMQGAAGSGAGGRDGSGAMASDGSGAMASDGSGATGSGGLGGSGAGGRSLPDDVEFTYDPSKDMDVETCAATEIASEEIYLDMFVMLDQSLSMGDDCDVGDGDESRWCNSINALYGFFADPTTVGTGVSLGTFSGDSCDVFDMDVGFGLLESGDSNGHLADLEAAMNDEQPNGYTNTQAAVETLIAETASHMPSGTRRTISILITDGAPTRCPDIGTNDDDGHLAEMQELNELLVAHYDATGIPSFIIGMEDPQIQANKLEAIAEGAGAELHSDYCLEGDDECSYYSVPSDGDPQVFMAALESIRSSVLGCEYTVPSSDVGLSDLETLEVRFTPDEGQDELVLEQVGDESSCSSPEQYWVEFPDNEDPIIKLCPATCELRGEDASVDISLKCEGS